MNYRTYFRNAEALYTMRLIVPKIDNVIFESKQKVGTYILFDTGGYLFRIEFSGYKYSMTKFYAAVYFILILIGINCDTAGMTVKLL